MAGFAIASLCVGVQSYNNAELMASQDRLNYAVADARWFHEYFKAADGSEGSDDRHILLVDDQATQTALKDALSRLSVSGPFDLFVLFLAGHGSISDSNGWFSLADAKPREPDLDGHALDTVLQLVRARSVILVADCCHAAAIIENSQYFSRLGAMTARTFLGASRRDQRSWEDHALKGGLFSSLMRDILSEERRSRFIDLESEVFRPLQRELPLRAMRVKQGVAQDPVWVGASSEPVLLPAAGSGFRGVRETPRRAALAILRYVGIALVLVLLAATVAVQSLTYHFAVDDGRIVVRTGLRELAWTVPPSLRTRADTGFGLDDVGDQVAGARDTIQNGAVQGLWAQRNERGVLRWIERLTPLLKREKAWVVEANVSGRFPEPSFGGKFDDLLDNRPWGPDNELIARVAALAITPVGTGRWEELSSHEWHYAVGMLPKLFPDCSGAPRATVPLDAFTPPPSIKDVGSLAFLWERQQRAIATGYEGASSLFIGFAHAIRSAAENGLTNRDTLQLAHMLADGLSALRAARSLRGEAEIKPGDLASLKEASASGCSPWIEAAMIRSGLPEAPGEPFAKFVQASGLSTPGDLIVADALLADLARNDRLSGETVRRYFLQAVLSPAPWQQDFFVPPGDIRKTPRLDPATTEWLLRRAEDNIAEDRRKAAVLPLAAAASQISHMSVSEVDRLKRLLDGSGPGDPLVDVNWIAFGYLGNAGLGKADAIESAINGIDWSSMPMPSFAFDDAIDPLPMTLLDGTRYAKLIGIGRAAQKTCLSPDTTDKLRTFMAENLGRTELRNFDDFVRGIAAQDSPRMEGLSDAEDAIARLREAATSPLRQLTIMTIVAHAASWTMPRRADAIADLRIAWSAEQNYDQRAAIADLILALHESASSSLSPQAPLACVNTHTDT